MPKDIDCPAYKGPDRRNGKILFKDYWPIILAGAGIVAGYSTLQAKVISLDAVSKDTAKTVAVHDVRFAEFSISQKYISEKVDKIDSAQEKILEAIQKIKR